MSSPEKLKQRNNVAVDGDGPATLVFVHGFGCDQSMWRFLAPTYASRFRVVRLDLVGSGASDLAAYDPVRYGSLHGYAEDLAQVIDAFARGPVVFVGHSVSAVIGALTDLRAPGRIHAHVMIGPSPSYIDDGDYVGGFSRADIDAMLATMDGNYLAWSSAMAPAIMGTPDRPELGAELTRSFCRADPDIARHFARVTFLSDHRADMAALQTPALIVQSRDDFVAPVAVGDYLQRTMPRARMALIDNIGHCAHMSAPAACMQAIDEFLLATDVAGP